MRTENQQPAPSAIAPNGPPPGAETQPGAGTVPGGYASDKLPQVTTSILPAIEGTVLPSGPATEPASTTAGATEIPSSGMPGSTADGMPAPTSGRAPKRTRVLDWRIVSLVLVSCVSIGVWRAVTVHARAYAKPLPAAQAVPVAVVKVTRQDLYSEVPFPAEFRPYEEVELHAKVSGYVRDINVDFGDRVKAGQLLATLEVPELQDQLHNAIATWEKTEADYTNAHLIYMRLAAVDKAHPNLVAQQDLDTAEAKDRSTFAAIGATKADVEKFHTLCAYTKITAPFDGVITKRYADPGSLIQAGTASDTQSMPLVRVSDNYLLRLDFPVDLPYVKDVHVGDAVDVQVESLGGKTFTGTITRSTLRVNEETRTMITEIEVPNPNLEIVPGMYCRVLLKVQCRPHALAIPIQAVPPGYGATVDVVNQQGQIEERQVKLGLETANHYEVVSGLKEGEMVLVGSRTQIQAGEKVEPKLVETLAQQ